MTPKGLVFDVFGTVVDWRSGVARDVRRAWAAKGREVDALAVADAWRAEYQPAMGRIRDGGRGYVPLDDLHRENLQEVLAARGETGLFDADELTDLARAWERLPPWPDAPAGLRRLRTVAPCATCSNGSISLMLRLARFAGLEWDAILGAEIARDYKPAAAVYRAAAEALRADPAEVVMVACHPTDLDAAAEAGLRTAYVLRAGELGPDRSGEAMSVASGAVRYDWSAEDMHDLADRMGAGR